MADGPVHFPTWRAQGTGSGTCCGHILRPAVGVLEQGVTLPDHSERTGQSVMKGRGVEEWSAEKEWEREAAPTVKKGNWLIRLWG